MINLSRWIGMSGKFGKCPEDYNLFKAAQWLGVAPWELLEQSIWWKERAIKFMNAEVDGEKIKEQHK